MQNSSDLRKQCAARLAERLIKAQDLQSVEEILAEEAHHIVMIGSRKSRSDNPEVAHSSERRVGAWIAQESDDGECFVRSDRLDPMRLFSTTERIPPKSGKQRVVLVGESVARGYLYDPHFNCAIMLQELLNLTTGSEEIEVVDLAQNGLTYAELQKIIESALVLKPDAFVIFAGNNWKIPSGLEVDRIIKILREDQSWLSVLKHIEKIVQQAIKALVTSISKLSVKHSIPIVFVIPEFNVADCQSLYEWRSPLMIGERSRRWRKVRVDAERALASRDYDKVAIFAKAMIDLDGGLSTTPYEMLAMSSRALGNNAEARRFVDHVSRMVLCLPVPKSMRCYPVIQDTLRVECAANAVTVVDLPAKISEYLSGGLPDRTLFLDNCHLTHNGIQLAMACTAEKLLTRLGRRARSWRELNRHQVLIDPRVLAQAHFSAAVINARDGQGYEIVRYHFAQAIAHAPEIVELGLLYADFNLRQTPYMMCQSFEDLLSKRNQFPMVSFLAAGEPDQENQVNMLMIRALRDAVAEKSVEAGKQIEQLLRDEYAVRERETNLLSRSSCDLNMARLEDKWWMKAAYFQAREPESRFHLVLKTPTPIKLKLTARLHRQPLESESVLVKVNGRQIAEFKASTRWNLYTLIIPAETLKSGLNSLVMSWPEPQQSLGERLEEIIKYLGDSDPINGWYSLPEVFPIYGEIHAFSAALYCASGDLEELTIKYLDKSSLVLWELP